MRARRSPATLFAPLFAFGLLLVPARASAQQSPGGGGGGAPGGQGREHGEGQGHEHGEGHAHEHHHGHHHHGHPGGHPGDGCKAVRSRPAWGGLGWISGGLLLGGLSAMERTLGQPAAFGPGYDVPPAALLAGGGGGALLGSRVWLGGKGFGLFAPEQSSDRGGSRLNGGGGGFELGYAVMNARDWLVVPFFGVGSFGYNLRVKNRTGAALPLYPGEEVPVAQDREIEAGFWTAEIGVRANRLLFWENGGFTVGAELGYITALSRSAWTGGTEGAGDQETAGLGGVYFRLVLGGGGFSYAEP